MKNILILFPVFFCLGLKAQENIKPVFCGNEVFDHILQEKYPALKDAFTSTFEEIRNSHRSMENDPLEINVVVHVVWKAVAENLNDSIIHNQILILNNDYNRANADTANLRSTFQAEAGKTNIHFKLAGIVRVQTDQLFNIDLLGTNLLTEVKHDVDGGSEAWNPDEYLNIWICNIQPITIFGVTVGQILGFAFPPNNLQNWPVNSGAPSPGEDGVVIDYRVFGSNNPNSIENPDGSGDIVVKGRTPVHEVGHYLGLRHIWGDGGLLGPNNCDQSDGIDDTPFANAQSAFDCDTSKNTCSQIESHYNEDVPDLIENYMDYASEACMNMFTHDQAQLMRNTLQGPRSGLLIPVSGISVIDHAPPFKLSPNPAYDQVTIDVNLPEDLDIAVRILNLEGQLMLMKPIQKYSSGFHQINFQTDELNAGIYVVELRSKLGVRSEKLLISAQ
ncbi:MAG TPA: M43 family zinc metalloprotease [Saprospiraceae bacterium]|nr:M43 family zinc metalloprotease [Saprospiraceae bacterium]